jgi:hypothetical protein
MVYRNEKKWGLDRARLTLKTRMVLYRYEVAIAILRAVRAI